MYAICASPLAKIFQPHLQDALIDNPANIFVEDNSTIYVDRASGRIAFTLGQPKAISTPQSSDKCEDTPYLLHWLTGGSDGQQVQETECYGIVSLDLPDTILGMVTQAVHASLISGVAPMIPEDARDQIKAAKSKASLTANARVMRAIRRCWDQLQKQYEINTEAGLGKYKPSKSEILCQFVLKREIAAEKARQAKIEAEMNETLSESRTTETKTDEFAKMVLQDQSIDLSKEEPAKRKRRTKAEMAEARASATVDKEVDAFAISEEG